MQRIVFVNLHGNEMLVKTLYKYLFKQSIAIKHKYLLDYLLSKNDEYEVCSFINKNGFSLFKNLPETTTLLNHFRFLEHRIILKANHIPLSKIHLLKNAKEIANNDIILLYRHGVSQYEEMENIRAFKAVSLIHFFGTADESRTIRNINPDILFNESDLSANSRIFNEYYSWYSKEFIVHPFVPAERFKNIKPFAERQNKCFSTGTITYKTHPEFLSVYGDPCDQPARKLVKDNPEFFKDTVDCYSSDYLEDNPGKQIKESDCAIVKLYKKVYNSTHIGKQKKYFSFNMVEKFNDYKMHLVGEEILGVPGIGFVEGMACGSAYIGIDSPMYRDLGLIPGVHYIAYDGTKEGLKATVEYYQKQENQEELARIAATGCKYVQEHFNGETAARDLLEKITQLAKQR